MNENSFENQKSKEQGPLVRIEIAREDDWQAYRDLKMKCVSSDEDIRMLGIDKEKIKEWNENFDNADYWKKELKPDNLKFVFLAFDEDEGEQTIEKKEALGTISAKGTVDVGVWYIYASYVEPNLRKKGLGKAILATCLDEIGIRGGYKASMRVNIENEKQLELARKFYFEIDKSRKILDGECFLVTDVTDERVIKKINEVLDAG